MLAERGTSHSVSLGHRNDSGMTISTANASGSILVVDDQPANLRVVSALLSRHGYEVITADSGEEALAIASEQAPDLMLLDMIMPGMDGLALLKWIKQRPALLRLPVVFLIRDTDNSMQHQRSGEG